MQNMLLLFSQFIKGYFFSPENIGDLIVIAVDQSVIDDFCRAHEVSFDVFRNRVTADLKRLEYNIGECFFGVVAIQAYVASLMSADSEYSKREYNPRLQEYLEIYDLQKWYRDHQEDVWGRLKNWASCNEFDLHLPPSKKGKGRYCQYPKSQCLLNREDLKSAPLIFCVAGLRPNEVLSKKEFTDLISRAGEDLKTSHHKRVESRLRDEERIDLLYDQLFRFYNQEDWPTIAADLKQTTNPNQHKVGRISLVLGEDRETLFIGDSVKKDLTQFDLFSDLKNYFKPFHRDIFIFELDAYTGEWEDVRFIRPHNHYTLILHHQSELAATLARDGLDSTQKGIHQLFNLTERSLEIDAIRYLTSEPRPYQLQGGLTLNRHTYMRGAGPTLAVKGSEVTFWINGKSYNSGSFESEYFKNASCGEYIVKFVDFPPQKISIRDANEPDSWPNYGWLFDKKGAWNSTDDSSPLIGLSYFDYSATCPPMIAWREELGLLKTKQELPQCQVISAIRRAKYEI